MGTQQRGWHRCECDSKSQFLRTPIFELSTVCTRPLCLTARSPRIDLEFRRLPELTAPSLNPGTAPRVQLGIRIISANSLWDIRDLLLRNDSESPYSPNRVCGVDTVTRVHSQLIIVGNSRSCYPSYAPENMIWAPISDDSVRYLPPHSHRRTVQKSAERYGQTEQFPCTIPTTGQRLRKLTAQTLLQHNTSNNFDPAPLRPHSRSAASHHGTARLRLHCLVSMCALHNSQGG